MVARIPKLYNVQLYRYINLKTNRPMVVFRVTVDRDTEELHAKHVSRGEYIVRPLRTSNFVRVERIETLNSNNGQKTYRIKSFYPVSKYYGRELYTEKVERIR